ncbi:hypothetical protein [Hyalangium rubrum]|uniref:Uncharacterized protein n=1 Tax=Hyalangium rubrum TaxID=3103134 RepID=A0ABU5H8S5_9BACT|nr:hypothetical protein [Hyalangium sp. s54d21]MDY7229167.1 hypothetical protein [Hyalangium sp. s54d21]
MANRQRGPLPPVMSTEETRVKPPEEDEAELPPEEPSWDPQRDQTQLLSNTNPPAPSWEDGDEATPPVPRKIDPIPLAGPDDKTRPIPRKTGARPALQDPDDATRPIPRKTGARPALPDPDVQGPDEVTGPVPLPRKTGARPALEDPDDATRPIPRKTGARPALQDADDATRPIPRKSQSIPGKSNAALPWEPKEDDDVAFPTTAMQQLPPIVTAPYTPPPTPSGGPPVLSPVAAPPPRVPASAPFQIPLTTQPEYHPAGGPSAPEHFPTEPVRLPSKPPAPSPVFTQPNYVSPPSAPVAPIVTAPHLVPAPKAVASAEPPAEELRTAFSNKAALIADLVKATFARRSYGIAPYRLRIDEPDGPSTAGGLHARQPISLVANLESTPTIVCGWVDVAKKEAQLRSYGVVVKRHQNRYREGFDITEEEYERFLNELVDTLFYGGIKILVMVPDDQEAQQAQSPGQAPAQQRAPRSSFLGKLLLAALAFALGLGVGMNKEQLTPVFEAVFGQR